MKKFDRNKSGRYEVAHTPVKRVQADEWRHDLDFAKAKGYIPIVTSLPKHEKVERVGFQMLARVKRVCEIVQYGMHGRFKTLSDVYRAASYIGAMVLFKMHEDQMPYKGKAFFELARLVVEEYDEIDMLDMVVQHAGTLLERVADGSKTLEEIEIVMGRAVATLPENLQNRAKAKIQDICYQKTQTQFPTMKRDWGKDVDKDPEASKLYDKLEGKAEKKVEVKVIEGGKSDGQREREL